MDKLLEEFVGNKPGTIFRTYTAAVLLQFSLLSFCSVQMVNAADILFNLSFWFGVFSSFGACSLLLRNKFIHWKAGSVLSEIAAVMTFAIMSYDYLTQRPPLIAGSILSLTAILFLIGGLVYERRTA